MEDDAFDLSYLVRTCHSTRPPMPDHDPHVPMPKMAFGTIHLVLDWGVERCLLISGLGQTGFRRRLYDLTP